LRAKRGKNARYSAAIAAEKEVHSDDDQPTHKKRKRTSSKGKKKASASDEEESPYSTEDGNDTESDSDAQAEISHEEVRVLFNVVVALISLQRSNLDRRRTSDQDSSRGYFAPSKSVEGTEATAQKTEDHTCNQFPTPST
jgi:hypothetical protein